MPRNPLIIHHRKFGFTLVELLVVITIIGILISLLLPAVQAAREAARRLQCTNNLKQVGLALHNYHSVHQVFRPGGTTIPLSPHVCGTGTGVSWLLFILPYLEQNNVYDKTDTGCAGDLDYSPRNMPILKDFAPSTYICPSSRMAKFSYLGTSHVNVFLANYAGIAGADEQDPANRFAGNNNHAYNGILFANSAVGIEAIRDGTSNVMMVGEQSEFGYDSSGNEADCRSGGPHGAWLGCMKFKQEDLGYPTMNRVFNTTTIGRPLGTRTCDYIRDYSSYAPYWVGIVTNLDNRAPILSAHPGGAAILMADGSVHFFAEAIEFNLFQLMAIRDSGRVKQWQ